MATPISILTLSRLRMWLYLGPVGPRSLKISTMIAHNNLSVDGNIVLKFIVLVPYITVPIPRDFRVCVGRIKRDPVNMFKDLFLNISPFLIG